MIEYYSKKKVKASVITDLSNDKNNIFIHTGKGLGKGKYSFPYGIINDSIPNPKIGDYLVNVDEVFFIMDKDEFEDGYASVN